MTRERTFMCYWKRDQKYVCDKRPTVVARVRVVDTGKLFPEQLFCDQHLDTMITTIEDHPVDCQLLVCPIGEPQ